MLRRPKEIRAAKPGPIIRTKIAMQGDNNVGKSSIVKRYCDSSYSDGYKQTLLIDFEKAFKTTIKENHSTIF